MVTSRTNAPTRSGPALAGSDDLMSANEFDGERHERHEQAPRSAPPAPGGLPRSRRSRPRPAPPSTISTATQNGMPRSTASASPPNSPTSPSHAIDDNHCSERATPPGTECHARVGQLSRARSRAPRRQVPDHSEPSTVPTTIATSPSQNPSPSVIASVPVKTPVMFTCGANHTVNSRAGLPYRWSSPMGAMPWVSTPKSPDRVGLRPRKAEAPSALRAPNESSATRRPLPRSKRCLNDLTADVSG